MNPKTGAKLADNAADLKSLAADLTQLCLDITGVFDPTPISDGGKRAAVAGKGRLAGGGFERRQHDSLRGRLGEAGKIP